MTYARVEAYLKGLADALAARGAGDPRAIEEARAHLLDAVEAALARGLSQDSAEREAIAAFGAAHLIAAHTDSHMLTKRLLTAACCFTLLATLYLSLSVAILRPPRLNYAAWFAMATFFVAQSAMTLVAGMRPGDRWIRYVVFTGSVALACTGTWWVLHTLTGPHFEGYALVLGSAVTVQALLTFATHGFSGLIIPRRRA